VLPPSPRILVGNQTNQTMSASSDDDSAVNQPGCSDDEGGCSGGDKKQVYQDASGKLWGTKRGVLTTFVECVISPMGEPETLIAFDEYRSGVEEDDYDEAEPASNIMSPSGYHLLVGEDHGKVDFVFTVSIVGKWPLYVEWMGPKAKIAFMSCSNMLRSVHEQTLVASEEVMQKTMIVRSPANKSQHYGRIRILLEESGGGSLCGVRFVFSKPRAPRKAAPVFRPTNLGHDLEADEARKDVTLKLKDGEELKVHSMVLRLYSSVYEQRFANDQWKGASINLGQDSVEAWTLILKSCLYEVEPLDTDSEFFIEAMEIAYRDNITKFSKMGWMLVKITKANVVPLLRKGWLMKQEQDDDTLIQKCVDKCFDFIFKNIATFESSLMMTYTACLQDFPDMLDYADVCGRKKRRRA